MADRVSVLMAAKSVALSARTACLTAHAVENMRVVAEELLPRGDDLRAACIQFATMFEAHRRDPYALRILGEGLDRQIDQDLGLLRPELRQRRDIDG